MALLCQIDIFLTSSSGEIVSFPSLFAGNEAENMDWFMGLAHYFQLWHSLANQTVTVPCYTTPRPCHGWSYKPTESVRNVHALTAVGESDSFLSLCPHPPCPFNKPSTRPPSLSPSSPLHPLLFESFGKVALPPPALSVSLLLMSTPMRGQEGHSDAQMAKEKKKKFLPWDTLYWVSCPLMRACCLIRSSCSAPALVLAPVQCLIDAAALPSSSLSMCCSSAPLPDGVAAIKPKGLSASQGYLN